MTGALAKAIWEWEFQREWSLGTPLREAYADLPPDDAGALAAEAVATLESAPRGSEGHLSLVRGRVIDLLTRLACFHPGVLSGQHRRLIDQGVLTEVSSGWGCDMSVLFYRADSDTRDRLIQIAEAGEPLSQAHQALAALAWIDDDQVRQTYRGWAAEPPPWTVSRGREWLLWFLTSAGWTFDENWQRRSLFTTGGYRLTADGDPDAASVGGLATEGQCLWCRGPLTVVMELAPHQRGLSAVALPEHLELLTCEFCVCYGTVYVNVDPSGSTSWSSANVRPEYLPEGSVSDRIPRSVRSLGPALVSPFEVMAFGCDEDISQLGGFPAWIQDSDYPPCPRCRLPMPFLGQVDTSRVAWGEGAIYAFFDGPCGTAATLYQQT